MKITPYDRMFGNVQPSITVNVEIEIEPGNVEWFTKRFCAVKSREARKAQFNRLLSKLEKEYTGKNISISEAA
jgi:hypothetical protein